VGPRLHKAIEVSHSIALEEDLPAEALKIGTSVGGDILPKGRGIQSAA